MNPAATIRKLISEAIDHGLTPEDISRELDRLSSSACSNFGKFGLNRVRSLFSYLADTGAVLADLLEDDTDLFENDIEPTDLW